MQIAENDNFVYQFGKFVVDSKERTLFADGVPVHLPAKEFDTLLLLIRNSGHALSKEEMIAAIWQDAFVEESNLAKQISRLRKLLNTNGEEYIETLPKHGYRFNAEVQRGIVEPDDAVLLEKRTVRRVTFDVDEEQSAPLALPGVRRSGLTPSRIALLVVAIVGVIVVALYYQQVFVTKAQIDPYAPIRLTDNRNDDTSPGWSKDGRIRFTRIYPDDRYELMIMNADGSDQTEIKPMNGRRVFGWSSDEQQIMYVKDGDPKTPYISNADGSHEAVIPHSGIWSNDGSMIVYHHRVTPDNFDIFVYKVATGEIVDVTNSPTSDMDPSFSPDGKRVVFTRSEDGISELYSIGVDGSDLRRLTFDPGIEYHAAYSPDGTQIAFGSNRENEDGDIYVMNADGSNITKLTHFDKSIETSGPGCWSPDGTKIVFWSDRNGKDDVYIVNAEVSKPRAVISDSKDNLFAPAYSPDGTMIAYQEQLEDRTGELKVLNVKTGATKLVRKTDLPTTHIAWSPDGNWIAFHDRINGSSEVVVVRPDGTEFRDLTNDPSADSSPAWSPDGTRILFSSSRDTQSNMPQIFVMNADGSEQHRVNKKLGWDFDPTWSNDSSKMIFVCDREDIPGNGLDVCQVNLDGTGETRLLSRIRHDTQPAVSPDGKRIAFVAASDGNGEIYVMNVDGSGLVRLTRNEAQDSSPSWSPDGKKIIFTSNRDGKFAIYEIAL